MPAGLAVVLTIHVAAAGGAPVADDAWLDHELEVASERLPATFSRVDGPGDDLPDDVTTVADRDALAALDRDDGTVHVFVAARVADKDSEGDMVGGVTWTRGRHRYIILSHADAREDTLAHELGHFFGLTHTSDPRDLMTPTRAPGGTLTDGQTATVRRRVTAFTRR